MKFHYFDQDKSDQDDLLLKMAIGQGYVPKTCLLGGQIIMGHIKVSNDPCKGCECDRVKCKGREKDDYPTDEEYGRCPQNIR